MQESERFLKPTENCEVISSLKFNAFIMNAVIQIGFNSSGAIAIRLKKISNSQLGLTV